MEWFNSWWAGLELIEQVFYLIAIPSTLFLVIQAVLIVAGAGDAGIGDGGTDIDTGGVDFDGGDGSLDSMGDSIPSDLGVASLFSIQGIASFFAVFGWGSLLLYQGGVPVVFAVIASVLLGFLVMYAIAKIMFYLSRLAHSGTLNVKNLLGSRGTVYLKIPPKGEGRGKVMVQTSERLVEFDAVTETGDSIPNNAEVRVIDILGENVLVVEKQ